MVTQTKGKMVVTSQGRTAFDYHHSETYEISTDLNCDEIGEYVTEEIKRAWKAGLDPVKDCLTIHLGFK